MILLIDKFLKALQAKYVAIYALSKHKKLCNKEDRYKQTIGYGLAVLMWLIDMVTYLEFRVNNMATKRFHTFNMIYLHYRYIT